MARTGCAFAAVTCRCGPARTRRDRQVLPAYGLQALPIENHNPQPPSKSNTVHPQITLGENHGSGHFYLAKNRTFLLCVDIGSCSAKFIVSGAGGAYHSQAQVLGRRFLLAPGALRWPAAVRRATKKFGGVGMRLFRRVVFVMI